MWVSEDKQAFLWHLSRSYQGTDYTKTDKSSPGIVHQGADYTKTDKSSPGIVHQGADYTKTDKPSPGTSLEVTRGQTTLSEYVCE